MKRPSATSIILFLGVLILFGGSVACTAQFNLTGPGDGREESGWPGGIMLVGLVFMVLALVVHYVKSSKTWKPRPKQINPVPASTTPEASSNKGSGEGEVVDEKK